MQSAEKCPFGWVYMSNYNVLFVDQSSTNFFFVQRGKGCGWSKCIPICDTSYLSGDIRDQSRKLSEIAPNFGHFFALPNFMDRPSKSHTHFITTTSQHVAWKKFCEETPTSPEVIVASMLNFKPNFKFLQLKFFGGTPVFLGMCASKPSSISSACKNLRAHPKKVHFRGSKLTSRSL